MEELEKEKTVYLGDKMTLEKFMTVVRLGARVEFSEEYKSRVNKSRSLVESWVQEEKVMYGVTTGFGALCTKAIKKEEAEQLQKNIILSHSTSVGTPFSVEESRAVMLMILQNLGQGFSGVRLEVLEQYRTYLNQGITPWAPKEGSVGYLSPEAHMALTLIGEGKVYYQNELMETGKALKMAEVAPITLSTKEGLALVSGTTSTTGLGAIAIYDMIKAALSADVIGALSLESAKGLLAAFDERVMSVRPHKEQADTAATVRKILGDSQMMEKYKDSHLQDALSLRCIPQLHGAAKKTLYDAKKTIEIEMNACCDNPMIWPKEGDECVISACNADSSYVGVEMDSACIAATTLAKMSERRNNRLIDANLCDYPSFLVANPGLNSGLMIPQYTQAGLLNDMRILSTPATIDNTPTCGNQEDYVAMGYNASKKAVSVCEKLEYILAIELLSDYETTAFDEKDCKRSSLSQSVYDKIREQVPIISEDVFLHPHIEFLRNYIHSGELLNAVKKLIGEIQ